MSFEKALAYIKKVEGGYSNNPNDRGGPTNMGITQSTYSKWLSEHGDGEVEVREMQAFEAACIYKEKYWKPSAAGAMTWPLSLVHFDGAVNHGKTRAAKILQEVVGTDQDGWIGPVTMAAVKKRDPFNTAEDVLWARIDLYWWIAKDPSQLGFLRGWLSRLAILRGEYHT